VGREGISGATTRYATTAVWTMPPTARRPTRASETSFTATEARMMRIPYSAQAAPSSRSAMTSTAAMQVPITVSRLAKGIPIPPALGFHYNIKMLV